MAIVDPSKEHTLYGSDRITGMFNSPRVKCLDCGELSGGPKIDPDDIVIEKPPKED